MIRWLPHRIRLALWLLCLLMLVITVATGCAGAPDRTSCTAGLTPERAQYLMDWTAGVMQVETGAAPQIVCATEAELDLAYRAAGAAFNERRLAAYLAVPPTVMIHWRRAYPEGNEHLIVHEFCHDRQWASGLGAFMTRAGHERQCDAVHQLWLEQRP